jgi:serine/threonine protein kinase
MKSEVPIPTFLLMEDYTIIKLLRKGSICKTFHGVHKHDGLDYCIKQVDVRGISENALTIIQNEAKILARLKHPNIVEYKTSFVEENSFCVITKFITGQTLADLISQHPAGLPSDRTASIIKQLIDAVSYMHSNGIIHRDIKPANILLMEDDRIKVCDFGLSKDTQDGRTTSLIHNDTLQYVPPEYFDENLPLTNKSDVWSIGVILFEMLTGQSPFADLSLYILMGKIQKSEPLFPDNAFTALLRQLLQKEPSKRPLLSSISLDNHLVEAENSKISILPQDVPNDHPALPFSVDSKDGQDIFDVQIKE